MTSNRPKTFSGRRASQDAGELGAFIGFLVQRGVTRYLEIGARHGDTFHAVVSALPNVESAVAADMPGGLWGTDKSRKHLLRVVDDLNAHHTQAKSVAMFGDSQNPEFAWQVAFHGPFDAILIDGDHTFAGVSRDWELYGGMAPIIAFHDIVGTGQAEKVHGNKVEVPLLWAELRKSHQCAEFVSAGSTMGIGVLWK